ncbi:MAG: gliding motility-associated-like protein, partial [Patiriisocius sp.]
TVNQNVILINTTDPVTTCPADITVGFDLNCQYTLLDYTAGASAIDNCSASPAITFTQSPVSGKVVTGSTVITITAEDEAGNTGTCTFNIIASDSIDPVTPTLTDITGQCSATATAPTTTDNCAGTVTGTTSDALTYTTQGTHVIAWLFDDGNGNSITVNQNVIISDVTVPMAICQDTTLVMDFITNDVTIDPTYINNGSFDQCGISSINLSASVFGPVGIYTTILLLEDVNGNNSSCTAQVNVIDAPDPPIAVCQDITLNLLADGTVSIPDSAIDGGSFDNTEIADMIASQLDFTCSDLGNNLVTLHVEDDEGNLGQCGATVTIIDDISPTLNCQNATVYLDSNGISLISYLDLVTSFNDNCGVFSIQLSQGDFDGTHLHSYNVIVEITDGSGNMNSCLSIVTVLDTIAPMLICTDLVIPLNASGFATVTSNQVGVGSSDNNLNLISFISDNINFDCTDIGDTLYSVIAVDPSGNSSTCDAIVTVVDNIAPTVLCQNFVLDLDDLNQGSITIADINNDNFDNCGIDSLSLSQYDFDENDLGINNVVLTAVDVNGNTRSCTATVRVNSTIPPDAVCQDISISLNVDGDVSIIAADVDGGSTDPNGQVSLTITQEEFTCANIGDNIVIMSAENTFGITTTCMATVSVVDDITPVLTCPTDKILPNDLEQCGAIVNYGPVSSEDNCAVSLELINGALNNTFFDVGITSIEYRATDLSGNETFCSFNVEVTDSETPRISCSVDIYSIDEIVTYDSPTFDDNCTAELVQIEGATTGSEFDHGFNEQTYLATDGAGLSAECSFTVTVNSDVVAVNDSVVSMEGVSIEIDALFNDFDPDGDDFSIVSANSSLGDVMIVEGKTLVYIPEIDWCGTDSIYYEIEDVFGSRSFATVYLEVSCDVQVFIPEGFSPNNDSVNDYFEIVGIENYPQAELNIYNRWSHIVYESKDYDNSWDGTMTNPLTLGKKIIPMGTYFYNLKIDDTITFKGYFYISR